MTTSTPDSSASTGQRPRLAQVVLGLFVVWQVVFLGASSIFGLVPRTQPEEGELIDSRPIPSIPAHNEPVREAINTITNVTDFWAGLTGQSQVWWLFAPNPPRNSTFVAVDLHWEQADGTRATVRLPSFFEPADPTHYFRPPGADDRLYHWDARFGLMYSSWREESFTREAEFWRDALAGRVRRQWKSLRAYLRWRANTYQHEHPDRPAPTAADLVVRIYPKPLPGQPAWSGPIPVELPLARWRPTEPQRDGSLPVEAYDPVTRTFAAVPVRE
jgi:hypothetical protein